MSLIGKAFSEIFTFSRASGGGRINAGGQFEWVAANQPRFDYSPINLASGTGSQTLTLNKGRVYALTVVGGTATVTGGVINGLMGVASGMVETLSGSGTADVTFTLFGSVTAVHVREVLGILIEEQRTNIAAVSSGSAASVFPSGAACSKGIGTAGTGYAGGSPGTIAKNAIGAGARGQVNYTITPGGVYSASIRLKKPGAFDGDFHAFGEYAETNKLVVFNPYTGAISFQGSGLAAAKIKDLGLWWGIEITCSMVGSLFAASYFPAYNQDGSYNESNAIGTGASRTIDGLQIEQGAFATSYIPTSGSQVTRAADLLSINTLSPWFGATEGSVAITFDAIAAVQPGIYPGLFTFEGASAADRIGAIMTPAQAINSLRRKSGSADSYAGTTATVSPNSQIKFAQAWNSASQVSALNGAAASGTILWDGIPAGLSKMLIGRFDATLNGHIRKLRYYPKRLSDAQLQALTA